MISWDSERFDVQPGDTVFVICQKYDQSRPAGQRAYHTVEPVKISKVEEYKLHYADPDPDGKIGVRRASAYQTAEQAQAAIKIMEENGF